MGLGKKFKNWLDKFCPPTDKELDRRAEESRRDMIEEQRLRKFHQGC